MNITLGVLGIAVAMASGLEGTQGIATIAPAGGDRTEDAVLTGRVRRFEEVDLPTGQEVRIRIEARLTSRTGEVLWRGDLVSDSQLTADSATGIVERMRTDLARLIDTAGREIAVALAGEG